MEEKGRPLTAAELLEHPEYPYLTWELEVTVKEKLLVGSGRGGPFNISYEIHGRGPIHIVWIMGMGGLKSSWQRQTKDFGHTEGDKYSCLVFDNRGIGESDKPVMRYSTSAMAHDVIELVDHVGWTNERELHVVGVSMGGMIAQEIACRIPKRIGSLTLLSTAGSLKNTGGYWENLKQRANLFIPRHIDIQIANTKLNLYSEDYLLLPDELEYTVAPFPTNGDRCAAMEIAKRLDRNVFPKHTFILQAIAANCHYKSPKQLAAMSAAVNPRRIMVIHGCKDRMLTFPHGEALFKDLGGEDAGVVKKWLPEQGHKVHFEMRKEFNSWVKRLISRAERMTRENNG